MLGISYIFSNLQVNAEPHMGSAYTTMAADAITRFQRLKGKRVSFVTGTDEHGEKIAEAAAKKGQEPQQHCDGVVASFKGLWTEVTGSSRIANTMAKHAFVLMHDTCRTIGAVCLDATQTHK